jgi:hypothetical protein
MIFEGTARFISPQPADPPVGRMPVARMVLIFGDTVLLPLALAWDVSMGVDNLFSLSAFEIF